jgi:hypothetical protein
MGTVVLEEGAGLSPSARVQGQGEMKDGLGQLCPGFVVLRWYWVAMPHQIDAARHLREQVGQVFRANSHERLHQ